MIGIVVIANHATGRRGSTFLKNSAWTEEILKYKRDAAIQSDLEYISEAVYDLYRRHLDNIVRSNDKLWGDFCRKQVDTEGIPSGLLELNVAQRVTLENRLSCFLCFGLCSSVDHFRTLRCRYSHLLGADRLCILRVSDF